MLALHVVPAAATRIVVVLNGRRAHVFAATVAGGVALLASGCGERAEPVGTQADLYPLTITTADDRPITLRAAAERIAVFDRGTRAILVALGAGKRIVDVGDQPDLVVAPSATGGTTLSQIAANGAAVYVMPDTSVREIERAITQLGLITAEPAAARGLVRDIESQRAAVAARLRGQPRVSAFVDLGHFTTASDQTLIGDLLREAGGRNVAAQTASDGPFDVRQLVGLDPDVYIATTGSGTSLATLRKHPRARKLSAVRRGRVVIVAGRLLEPGPAIGRGLEQLAEALHPGATG
jgi:ABC-type Fe3+-hydroxamate transport system substrate-binding protein